jgi:ubiquinone/menaquinone biosynthesis C-methylase UbiE
MPWLFSTFVRLFYKHFYNRFAFTYDFVSALVSRGEWRAWTGAAIPFLRGPRVLEVASGTGNLLLDLHAAGFAPVGLELSPFMIALTQRKLRARGLPTRLVRARAQAFPFPSDHFDSLVMTFPPGFATDARAMAEMRRVLAPSGRLVWVDAPYLYPRDLWSRFLNWAFQISSGAAEPGVSTAAHASHRAGALASRFAALEDILPREGWSWQIEKIVRRAGYVHVIVGAKQDR